MTVRRVFVAVIFAATLASCASSSSDALKQVGGVLSIPSSDAPSTTTAPTTTTTIAGAQCDPTASLRPEGPLPAPGDMPIGTRMHDIQVRGRLRVGVDQTTFHFGYRDPTTGELRGLDIDLLHQMAQAILGDPNKIDFKALTTGQRLTAVENGDVDMVASLVTMTCTRWQDVSFSNVYLLAHQEVLVPKGSDIQNYQDLKGRTVCATIGSTSLTNIVRLVPGVVVDPVATRIQCLVDLQSGKADAITSDNTILEGFHAQDPLTEILTEQLTDEPYGIVINHKYPELVRFVNAVLDEMRADGTLSSIEEHWLGKVQAPPPPRYKD